MLWFLALARKKGFEIASYEDDAEAVLDERALHLGDPAADGRAGRATRPTPRRSRSSTAAAHERCFIANSVEFPVEVGAGVSAELPLTDVRVLDLTRLLPGGFCSLLLADLGAEVLKVEDTGMGDYIRWAPPYYGDDAEQALGHPLGALPRAQPRQALGPARPQVGRRGARRCCGWSSSYDVVLDGFRPGVLDRLGVGYERMREANPAIVFCAITGYGQDGPNASAPATT